MKKLFLTAAAVLALTTVNAQDITFGAKAGVNLANADAGDFDTDAVTSFHIGVTAELPISDKFSVQPELLYSIQGAASVSDPDTTINTDFINLPIMAKYYVAEGLSLEAGPQIGFLVKAENNNDKTSETRDIKDSFKSVDFGFNIGAGYKLESGLNFALRYNLGLSDITEDDDDTWKNRVLQLSVGYTF
tara:strand:- start:125 stop:691 length:567 start_codon:yes stop_codon:yes gene_type:complete